MGSSSRQTRRKLLLPADCWEARRRRSCVQREFPSCGGLSQTLAVTPQRCWSPLLCEEEQKMCLVQACKEFPGPSATDDVDDRCPNLSPASLFCACQSDLIVPLGLKPPPALTWRSCGILHGDRGLGWRGIHGRALEMPRSSGRRDAETQTLCSVILFLWQRRTILRNNHRHQDIHSRRPSTPSPLVCIGFGAGGSWLPVLVPVPTTSIIDCFCVSRIPHSSLRPSSSSSSSTSSFSSAPWPSPATSTLLSPSQVRCRRPTRLCVESSCQLLVRPPLLRACGTCRCALAARFFFLDTNSSRLLNAISTCYYPLDCHSTRTVSWITVLGPASRNRCQPTPSLPPPAIFTPRFPTQLPMRLSSTHRYTR